LARCGSIMSNGSGDDVIAVSTAAGLRIDYDAPLLRLREIKVLGNNAMSPLFLATIEATEEAVLNSLFMADTMTGEGGKKVEALPVEEVLRILKKYAVI